MINCSILAHFLIDILGQIGFLNEIFKNFIELPKCDIYLGFV